MKNVVTSGILSVIAINILYNLRMVGASAGVTNAI
jgi:hypothetical protein